MINNCSVPNEKIFIQSTKDCKNLYVKVIGQQTNLFNIIEQLFNEITKVASKREKEISDYHHSDKKEKEKFLLKEKECLENRLSEIESKTGIVDLKRQLEYIKTEERKKGKLRGKSRTYFKKGTEEYERKQSLKYEIQRVEEKHEEYRILKKQIEDIKRQLNNLGNPPIDYDAAIGTLFTRISDITNNILYNIQSSNKPITKIDYSVFKTDTMPFLSLAIPNCSQAEADFFNITLKEIYLSTCRNISEAYILDLIASAANIFKPYASALTQEGQLIIKTLRDYWNYKHNKATKFDIPQNLPVFSSMMAFFIKPFGFDQMERFMQNRGIDNKQYGFMLWGAASGYASLPKTFTNLLYANADIYQKMDDYLFSLLHTIQTT